MTPAHLLLALVVIVIWGSNFVVIRWGLDEFPPLLLATLRFVFSVLPWLLFIRRPQVPWRLLAGNGLFMGFGMFGLLFIAMRADISPGMASLVMQTQAFFTIGLAMVLLRERLHGFQAAGLALCVAGMAVLFAHVDASMTTRGLMLALTGALCWAIANLIAKRAGRVDMLAFMVWSCLFAVPPLLVCSLWLEGHDAIVHSLANASWLGWGAALWQGIGNSLFGFGAWNWLLTRYPAATVTPLSLLVPVVGMASSALLLDEALTSWKIKAAVLVLLGLLVITLWPRLRARWARSR